MAIVDKLKVELLGEEKATLVKRYTENLDAYNLYLKGHYYRSKLTPEGLQKGIDYFEKAIEIDPDYALAYAGLAMLHVNRSFWGALPPHQAYPEARKAAQKALEIDENLAEAHNALGYIYTWYDWNWVAAEKEFERALELEPNSALIRVSYSHLLMIQKRFEEAMIEAKRALELDPLSSLTHGFASIVFYHAGRYAEAIEVLQETIARDPNDFFAHMSLGNVYREKNMKDEAIAKHELGVKISDAPFAVAFLAISYYRFDMKTEADELFDNLKRRSQTEYVPPTAFVLIHLERGEVDEACVWLDRVYKERDGFLCAWSLPPVQLPSDPRINEILKKMGLER